MKPVELARPMADWAKMYAKFGAETPDECWEMFKLVSANTDPDYFLSQGIVADWPTIDMEMADLLIFLSGSCT